MATAGGIQAVISGMKAHANDPDVQLAACSALWMLCRSVDVQAKAGDAGAVEAVIAALRVHSTHPGCAVHPPEGEPRRQKEEMGPWTQGRVCQLRLRKLVHPFHSPGCKSRAAAPSATSP